MIQKVGCISICDYVHIKFNWNTTMNLFITQTNQTDNFHNLMMQVFLQWVLFLYKFFLHMATEITTAKSDDYSNHRF